MMSDPLSNIPPLIPLPSSTSRPDSEESIDKFASLFSPPTPRASPTGWPKPERPIAPPKHVRQESDDFGAFVSVLPNQAPLVENVPGDSAGWSFFEEAKQRDNKKRQSLLAELDRPLFTETTPATSVNEEEEQNHLHQTESPSVAATQLVDASAEDVAPPSPTRYHPRRSPTLTLSSRPSTLAPPLASTPSISSIDTTENETEVPARASSLESAARHSRSYTDFSQSPPLTSRRRSDSNPSSPPPLTSYTTLTALSAKWMAGLLSGATTAHPPSTSSSLPALDHHTSPFAPKQPYQPPTGAPGYQGEREGWDKDGKWYGALERDLGVTPSAPSSSRSPIPASFTSSSSSSLPRTSTPPARSMSSLMTTSLPPLHLSGLQPTTSPVLTLELASSLRAHLPPLRRLRENWQLLYSLDQHGASLGTLYSRCDQLGSGVKQMKRVGEFSSTKDEFGVMGNGLASFGGTGGNTAVSGELGTIFAVQDSTGGIFGAWLGERLRGGEGRHFGSGESFLWKQTSTSGVEVFKWTGKNEYVVLCDNDYISFGGGDGSYGLYLDSALDGGSSAPCPTFDNPPLCEGAGKGMRKFECVGLEVWGI